jgi:DNA-binding MarR family transcriptional regulator
MVGKLAGKGFAVKRPATDNNKEILVFLTPSGWDAFAAHKDFTSAISIPFRTALGNYSEEQVETVDRSGRGGGRDARTHAGYPEVGDFF